MTLKTTIHCGPCQTDYPTLANVLGLAAHNQTVETECPGCHRRARIQIRDRNEFLQVRRWFTMSRYERMLEVDVVVADFAAVLEMIQTPSEFVALCSGGDL
jgi:hypothetical protein